MTPSPEELNSIDPERDDPSAGDNVARGVVIGVVGVGLAILTFVIMRRVMSIMNERWQVSSHGSSESIALLIFVTIALALIAAVLALPFIASRIEDAEVFAPVLLVLSILSAGLLAFLVAFRERIDLSVGSLSLLAILALWAVLFAFDTLPKLIGRIRRSASRRSIDDPQ